MLCVRGRRIVVDGGSIHYNITTMMFSDKRRDLMVVRLCSVTKVSQSNKTSASTHAGRHNSQCQEQELQLVASCYLFPFTNAKSNLLV